MEQTAANVLVAFKEEVTFNTDPGATGGLQLRLTPSPGLDEQRQLIKSAEIRSDMLSPMARLGSGQVQGSYSGELSLGTFDKFLEAIMRSAYTAAVPITQATMTSITITNQNQIVAAAGSWITQGVRVGDIVRLTGHAQAGNNDINLRVISVTASTITVAGTPLTNDAVADNSFTLTVLRKLKNGVSPVRKSFRFEQYYADLDESVVFGGCRIGQVRFQGTPDGMVVVEITIVGASSSVLTTGTAPFFTTPTLTTTIALVMADATIRFGGADIATLTSFDLTLDVTAAGQPVIGSPTTPNVFDDVLQVTGSISGIRSSLTNVTRFKNETELELHILLVEPDAAEPKDCFSIFIPRLKLGTPTAPLGGGGAMIETMPFEVGKKEGVTGYDDTMITFSSSV